MLMFSSLLLVSVTGNVAFFSAGRTTILLDLLDLLSLIIIKKRFKVMREEGDGA